MKKILGIQKLLFLVWTICLAVVMSEVLLDSQITPDAIIIAFLVGVASFSLVWLISLFQFFLVKPRINSTKLPLLSVAITLIFILGLQQVTQQKLENQPVAEVQSEKRCYLSKYTWEMVGKSQPCPAGTTETIPSPSIKPSPSSPSYYKNSPKPALIDCTGPDKVVFKTTAKECQEFNDAWNNTAKPQPNPQPVQNSQPSYDYYDYYVPSYTYVPSNYDIAPPPTFEPYVSTLDIDPIEVEPFPTIGPSYNPNENCETYTTNAGSITVCK